MIYTIVESLRCPIIPYPQDADGMAYYILCHIYYTPLSFIPYFSYSLPRPEFWRWLALLPPQTKKVSLSEYPNHRLGLGLC